MVAYEGIDYPKGTHVALTIHGRTAPVYGDVVAVGGNGNYVIETQLGSVTAHHSDLAIADRRNAHTHGRNITDLCYIIHA